MERSIGRPGPFPPLRFGQFCPPAHARSLGVLVLHAVCAIGRIEPVSAKKWLGNMAPFPWPLVFDRTFPFAFPEIACEEKGMGKGMRGKGMGTDRRFDSLARTFLCRNRPCAFRLRRRRIVVGIDHRAGNCRHFRGAVGWPSTGWATVAHSRASRGRTIQWTGAAETTGDVAAFHSRRPRDAGRPVAPNTVALIACLRCLI